MNDKATYEALAYCGNCAYEGPITAPVGEKVYEQACPLCACTMLYPVAQREWEREMRGPITGAK